MIKVVKLSLHTDRGERTVYIGRPGRGVAGSPLANPYRITASCSREQAIQQYDEWLLLQLATQNWPVVDEMNRLYQLAKTGDLVLACYCAPLACHGDVIKRLLEEKL